MGLQLELNTTKNKKTIIVVFFSTKNAKKPQNRNIVKHKRLLLVFVVINFDVATNFDLNAGAIKLRRRSVATYIPGKRRGCRPSLFFIVQEFSKERKSERDFKGLKNLIESESCFSPFIQLGPRKV